MRDPEIPDSKDKTAALLKSEWAKRSHSERAKFYIASHPGWDDAETWNKQAEIDAGFVLLGIDEGECQEASILEIGCGNGRLVPFLAPRVRQYTGIDICPEFIAECQTTHAALANVRFFETPGASIPEAALDQSYDLVFAAAVFIHCPKIIIESYFRAIQESQPSGTRLRFQVLTDPEDPSDIVPIELLDPQAHQEVSSCYEGAIEDQQNSGETEHVEDSSYQGHQFTVAELRQLLADVFGADKQAHVIRFDPLMANCEITI